MLTHMAQVSYNAIFGSNISAEWLGIQSHYTLPTMITFMEPNVSWKHTPSLSNFLDTLKFGHLWSIFFISESRPLSQMYDIWLYTANRASANRFPTKKLTQPTVSVPRPKGMCLGFQVWSSVYIWMKLPCTESHHGKTQPGQPLYTSPFLTLAINQTLTPHQIAFRPTDSTNWKSNQQPWKKGQPLPDGMSTIHLQSQIRHGNTITSSFPPMRPYQPPFFFYIIPNQSFTHSDSQLHTALSYCIFEQLAPSSAKTFLCIHLRRIWTAIFRLFDLDLMKGVMHCIMAREKLPKTELPIMWQPFRCGFSVPDIV